MAQVTATARTNHFSPRHAVAGVQDFFYTAFIDALIKARPAATRVELGFAVEQLLSATLAHIRTAVPKSFIFTRERPFGSLFAQHTVSRFAQLRAPFLFRFLNFKRVFHIQFLNYRHLVPQAIAGSEKQHQVEQVFHASY